MLLNKKIEPWETKVTDVSEGRLNIRGYDIAEMIGKLTFADTVFLILKGELPNKKEKRMMEAMLVSSIDHGTTPPSNLAARTVFSGGNPLNTAVAAGIMTIGDSHGGAIEQCSKILVENLDESLSVKENAEKICKEMKEKKIRIPGFGHRIHKRDPRSVKLFDIAKEVGFYGKYLSLAIEIQDYLEKSSGKSLPLNVDGAIAALMAEMDFDWRLGKGFFIISRTPGLVAHVFEEWTTQKRMRKLGPTANKYTGKEPREISDREEF